MIQSMFQEALGEKKCLVILDDIWNESRCKWLELRGYLMKLGRKSRILVTTRSRETSTIVGNGNSSTYELSGLSAHDSWRLFALMAFGNKLEQDIPINLVEIGHKIVKKCSRVPLALKVIGNLLFGQERSKWDLFEKTEVTRIQKGDNDIMSILKYSYLNLDSSLKSCFKYCAIFPKDSDIGKDMMIMLWEAQGYIVPFEEGQSIHDAGEEYFSILLKRCFFQEVVMNDFGEAWKVKIHDLMHELADELTKNEIWRLNDTGAIVAGKVRHISFFTNGDMKRFSFPIKIRSCIIACGSEAVAQVGNWKRLRVLIVNHPYVESLPDTIGNLLHLKVLDLSNCGRLGALPDSITQLLNLRVIQLQDCRSLKYLPKDLSKLEKLRHLNVVKCDSLIHMPPRMDKLTCLTYLPVFIVNEGNNSSDNQLVGELKDLQYLTKIQEYIILTVKKFINNSKNTAGGYLKNLEHIWGLVFNFKDNEQKSDQEDLMEKLEPHSNLQVIYINDYMGTQFSNWGKGVDDWAIFLPNLVSVKLKYCLGLERLPLLSRLRHLETLEVRASNKWEYMEDPTTVTSGSQEAIFFPSLVSLKLQGLVNLKGWWSNHERQLCFPHLYELEIVGCGNFASFLCFPSLEDLYLDGCNHELRISSDNNNTHVKTIKVEIDKLHYIQSMQMRGATSIMVTEAEEMTSLSEAAEVLQSCSSSLRELEFRNCTKLTSISGGLEHLRLLESLSVDDAVELRFDEAAQPWRSLRHSLRFLQLDGISNAVSLPRGLQCLTSLQHLYIRKWSNLESIPEWIGSLSSLTFLEIGCCKKIKTLPESISKLTSLHRLWLYNSSEELKQRCQQDPQGDDWPKIRHIPDISVWYSG